VVGKYFVGVYAEEGDCSYTICARDLIVEQDEKLEFEAFEEDSQEEEMDMKKLPKYEKEKKSNIEKEKTNMRISGSISISDSIPIPKSVGQTLSNTSQIPTNTQDDYDHLRSLSSLLPPEPLISDPNTIACLIRLPTGTNLTRNFNMDSQLQQLHDYVSIHALPEFGNMQIPKKFFFVVDFPKTEYRNMSVSFRMAGLTQKRCNIRIQSENV